MTSLGTRMSTTRQIQTEPCLRFLHIPRLWNPLTHCPSFPNDRNFRPRYVASYRDLGKRELIKKQRHYFANKGPSSQSYGFSSSHVWMWGLNYKESWAPKNWCFWTVMLEKTLESPLDCKKIKPVSPKGNQSWIFIGSIDAEAETAIVWLPDWKTWLIWKDPDGWERLKAGGEGDDRGWGVWMASPTQWTWVWASPRDGEGQWSLAWCSSWGCKESNMTEQLNNNNRKWKKSLIFTHIFTVSGSLHTLCSLEILDILWVHLSGLLYCL